MKISVIIPTHNRSSLLKNAIDSILLLSHEAETELIIVDNNSSDNTPAVARAYSQVRYVFEKSTAFTKARKTGGAAASGDILLFLDDDIILNPGSMRKLLDIFRAYPDCGIVAGKVMAQFTGRPPEWALACQGQFNGWSLYDMGSEVVEVPAGVGPILAIRRDVYDAIGGFPPDTVGVETNKGPKSFNKLYIGTGDYGLCFKAREAGYKVYYSPDVSVYHVIPEVRYSIAFWRSRLIGEGYCNAISEKAFFKQGFTSLLLKRARFWFEFNRYEQKLLFKLRNQPVSENGMIPEELWVRFYKAYFDMKYVVEQSPWLWRFLWEIGAEGVSDGNFDAVINRLPEGYKMLVSSELVYDPSPVTSVKAYLAAIRGKGFFKPAVLPFYKSKAVFALVRSLFRGLMFLYRKLRRG